MGWTGSGDTRTQVRLKFSSRDEALAYAKKYELDYNLEEPQVRRIRPKSYTENFTRRL